MLTSVVLCSSMFLFALGLALALGCCGALYLAVFLKSRNRKTHVVMHNDVMAASNGKVTAAVELFPAWLVRFGRRTRLASLLFDEPFNPHPLLLSGHAQTSEGRAS